MRLVFGTCGRGDPWQPGPSRKVPASLGSGFWAVAPGRQLCWPSPGALVHPLSSSSSATGVLLADGDSCVGVQPVDLGCLSILSLSSLHLRHSSYSLLSLPASVSSEPKLLFPFYWNPTRTTNPRVLSVNLDKSPLFLPSPTTLLPFIWQLGSSFPRTSNLSSRHSREFSSYQNVLPSSSSSSSWVGEWEGGFQVEVPGVLLYSFNSFTFPFLLCVTFT